MTAQALRTGGPTTPPTTAPPTAARATDAAWPATPRGVFVVFEGVDRSGKSTQCKLLVDALSRRNRRARLVRFPERSTAVGALIDRYLRKEVELDDRAVHLLFSANRWEAAASIRADLARGVDVVCDRYAYSGVAFTAAKPTVDDVDWCKAPDAGLPAPDLVLYLSLGDDAAEAERRGGYGHERYERRDMQLRVAHNFDKLRATSAPDRWRVIDAARDVDAVLADVERAVADTIDSLPANVGTLW